MTPTLRPSPEIMMTVREAAAYAGLPVTFFRHQLKHKTGPNYISPSERAKFFTQQDMDAWIASWRRKQVQ